MLERFYILLKLFLILTIVLCTPAYQAISAEYNTSNFSAGKRNLSRFSKKQNPAFTPAIITKLDEYTSSKKALIKSLKKTRSMSEEQKSMIYAAVESVSYKDFDSFKDLVTFLITPDINDAASVSTIIEAMVSKVSNFDAFKQLTTLFITRDMHWSKRVHLILAFLDIPKQNRLKTLNYALSLTTPHMNGDERARILASILGSQPKNLNTIKDLFSTLITPDMDESSRLIMIPRIILEVPSEKFDSFANQIKRLTQDLNGDERVWLVNIVLNLDPLDREAVMNRAIENLDGLHSDHPHYADRIIQLLETPLNDPLPPLNFDEEDKVVGQEALSAEKKAIQSAYQRLATSSASSNLISRSLPSAEEAEIVFNKYAGYLETCLMMNIELSKDSDFNFRLKNALRSLELLKGNKEIERHPTSSVESYFTYQLPGMPQTGQLFVLAYRLLALNPKAFVESWLGETFGNNKEAWDSFRSVFANNPQLSTVMKKDTVAQAIQIDRLTGGNFIGMLIKSLEDMENFQVYKVDGKRLYSAVKKLQIDYVKAQLDSLMPLIEALFMTMRGHNVALLKQTESNEPACAEGLYLGILKSITHAPQIDPTIQGLLNGISIQDCSI